MNKVEPHKVWNWQYSTSTWNTDPIDILDKYWCPAASAVSIGEGDTDHQDQEDPSSPSLFFLVSWCWWSSIINHHFISSSCLPAPCSVSFFFVSRASLWCWTLVLSIGGHHHSPSPIFLFIGIACWCHRSTAWLVGKLLHKMVSILAACSTMTMVTSHHHGNNGHWSAWS